MTVRARPGYYLTSSTLPASKPLPAPPAGVSLASVSHPGSASADAVSALQNLGFKPAVAASAVAHAQADLGEGAELNDLVRVALKRAAG